MGINNISAVSTNKLSFKGIKTTEKGNIYNKSNAGLATGCVIGGLGAASWASVSLTAKMFEKNWNEIIKNINDKEYLEQLKAGLNELNKSKKAAPYFAAIAAACSIACGVYIDKIRNKKSAEIADKVAKDGEKNVLMQERNLDYSYSRNIIYKSNDGKNKGALLGLICGLGHNLMCKSPLNIMTYGLFALGGYVCGAITDSIANKAARKNL